MRAEKQAQTILPQIADFAYLSTRKREIQTPPTMTKPKNYRPEIDGLRAIAVMSVGLFHAGFGFTGGYVGVDVFFVISGFLITGLILKAQDEDRFELKEFWLRRIRRLFPAMAVMQVCVLLAGLAIMLPLQLRELGQSSVAQLLLHSNFYFANELDYFAGPSELKPLLHTWSLAVEEQFYLVLPLLLIAFKRFSRTTLVRSLWIMTIASFGLCVWGIRNHPTETFFLLPFRAWELLLGGLLACATPATSNLRRDNALSLVGIAGITVGVFWFDSQTLFPGAAALLPCLATVMLIRYAGNDRTLVHRVLASRALVAVGMISYSLYLAHWPVLAFANIKFGQPVPVHIRVFALVASFGLGYLSWRFVETPFRKQQLLARPSRLVTATIACATAMVVTATVCDKTRGLPQRFDESVRCLFDDTQIDKRFAGRSPERVRDGDLPVLGDGTQPPSLLIWGDSHATALGHLCDSLSNEFGLSGYLASRGGVAPLLETWRSGKEETADWNNEVLAFVQKKQIKNVVLVSRWAVHVEKKPNGLSDCLLKDAASTEHSRTDSREVLARGLNRTIAALHKLGVRVWLVKQVPCQTEDPIRSLVDAAQRGEDSPPRGISRQQHLKRQQNANAILDSVGSSITLLDPAEHCFDESNHCIIGTLQKSFYSDENHVSKAGAEELVRPILRRAFQEIAATKVASNAAASNF